MTAMENLTNHDAREAVSLACRLLIGVVMTIAAVAGAFWIVGRVGRE